MIIRKLVNFIDFRFLHVYVRTTWKVVFKIWEIVKKIKMDVDRLLLVSKIKKSSILAKYTENFLHFHHMRRYWFFVKNHFRNFHHFFTFWDPLSQKKRFLRKCLSVCLSDCLYVVYLITLDRIIGLNLALVYFTEAEKVRTSSLTSYIWPK